jgi:hypothetical protein
MMQENELTLTGNPEMHKSTELYELSTFFDEIKTFNKGDPLTWGATPLDRMSTLQQQLKLVIDLQEFTYRDIPDDVDMEIIDFVHTTFAARFHGRAEANEENYMTSLNATDAVFSPKIIEMFIRGEHGHALPAELLLTRELKGIRSVELACLTHPYGTRIEEYLEKMRESVKDQVEFMGGSYYDEPETRYRVKEIIGYSKGEEKFDKGVLMTRKRTMGMMPDGTVIRERSSFVLRLDDSMPVTDEEREALEHIDLKSNQWQDELVKAGNLDRLADVLLEMNEYSLAIPIATTIYAYNPTTARLIEERDARKLAEDKAIFAKEYPIIAAAMNSDEKKLRVAEFRGDMFYFGPAEASEEPIEL